MNTHQTINLEPGRDREWSMSDDSRQFITEALVIGGIGIGWIIAAALMFRFLGLL